MVRPTIEEAIEIIKSELSNYDVEVEKRDFGNRLRIRTHSKSIDVPLIKTEITRSQATKESRLRSAISSIDESSNEIEEALINKRVDDL